MKLDDLARAVSYGTLILIGAATVFGLGLYHGGNETALYRSVARIAHNLLIDLHLAREEAATFTGVHPTHFLQPAFHPGSGVTVNEMRNDDLILLSSFFEDGNEIRLIDRNGGIVARWPVDYLEIFSGSTPTPTTPATDWNVDLHGILILEDGSVVFNFEYNGLVKLDRCNRVLWTLDHPTHHSIERSESSGFWVPGRVVVRKEEDRLHPFDPPYKDDTILRVSEDGDIVSEVSVAEVFIDNGLSALLTASGESFRADMAWDREIVHLNKIAELPRSIAGDFPGFQAGDLMISLREHNLVAVLDPVDYAIRWWQIGPWIRQHDPEFVPGGRIIVFNNNVYRSALSAGYEKVDLGTPRVSNILRVDPVSGLTETVYPNGPGQELLTVIRGKHQLTARGTLLITEFEGGRVFEVDPSGKTVWEYINRYDDDEVAEITEALVYPASYFQVDDWSCG